MTLISVSETSVLGDAVMLGPWVTAVGTRGGLVWEQAQPLLATPDLLLCAGELQPPACGDLPAFHQPSPTSNTTHAPDL